MAKKTASVAKITCPKITGIIPRRRLFSLMDTGRNYPVIWITGPPGSGKTTLIASYLDARKLPCLWYQVDEGDADIATFFYYMGIAAKKAVPGKRKPLPLLTPEYLQSISLFTRRYFEELYSRLKPPFVIVFDNYQDVSTTSGFHDMTIQGLNVIPEGINILVLSRNEPPQQLSRLRANNRMSLLGWNEIKFTADEFREVIQMKVQKGIPDKAIRHMHEKTDGWVAGLVLLTEIVQRKGIDYQLLNKLTPKEVFDYFASEAFSKIDKETQSFLLKTSFIPKITAPVAEKLSGVSNSGQILFGLNQNNYFTTMHLRAEPIYQYHPLFREFLLSRAKTSFNQEELIKIQRSAAALLEESGQVEDTATLLRDIRDFEGLAQLIINQASSLVAEGRTKTLEEWLISIPGEIVENTPWLLYWLGVCRLPSNPKESNNYFDNAFKQFRSQGDQTGMWLSWSYAVDTIFHEWADLSHINKYVSLFNEIHQRNTTFPSLQVEVRVVSCRFILMMLGQLHHPEITEWAGRVFTLLQKYNDTNFRLQSGYYLAVYYLWIGDFGKAGIVVNSLHKDIQAEANPPLLRLLGKTTEAMYAWLAGSTSTCLRIVSEALELAGKTGVHIWDHHLLSHGTCAALSDGDTKTAANLLAKIEPGLVTARKIDVGFYYFLSAWKSLLCNDLPSAVRLIEISIKAVTETHAPFPIAVGHFWEAQILFELGKRAEAENELNLVYQIGRSIKSKQVEYMCLLASAQFALGIRSTEWGTLGNADNRITHPLPLLIEGKNPQSEITKIGSHGQTGLSILDTREETEKYGLDVLRKAMELGREQGYVNMFGWRYDVMPRLCVKALEAGIEVAYVRDLIRNRSLIPDIPPLECENWPWPLKIFTLGRFIVLKDDKPFHFVGKVQRKPLELLKAITSFGSKEVSEDLLADALWPDAEGDMAHQSFETTLHRLRRLIGNDVAVKHQGGQLILDDKYFWVDTWAFERLYEQIESLFKSTGEFVTERNVASGRLKRSPQSAAIEAVRLSEKAIDIYKGSFLPSDTQYLWTVSNRERLRNKFLRLIIMSGNYLEQAGQWQKATEHYLRAIEIDDLTEEFYHQLMVCHYHLGKKAEAVKVYNRCRTMLSNVLGITPSPRTEAIYNDLIQKELDV